MGDPGPAREPRSTGEPWWAVAALSRFWDVAAERLERGGLEPTGRVTVAGLDRAEQRALTDLLGRPVLAPTTRVDLQGLDIRLRVRAGLGVVEAAAHATGRSLTDRRAVRADRSTRQQAPYAAATAWVADHPDLDWPWLTDWLDGLRRDGVAARDPDPGRLVDTALDVLWRQRAFLPGPSRRSGGREADDTGLLVPVARTELAARVTGDAHALDGDRRLAGVVLRAVLAATATPADADHSVLGVSAALGGSGSSSDRSLRTLWEGIGVLSDRVSSTCLTLGLRAVPSTDVGHRVSGYAASGAALHLTWQDLDAGLAFAPGQVVLVCENPRVLECAVDLGTTGLGFVCTSGRPALVTVALLTRLRGSGAHLSYHGDFDWAGLAMANDLARRCGVTPWRMTTQDYLDQPATLPLSGRRTDAVWDDELGPAMDHRGLAVHEEATLPDLVTEFCRSARRAGRPG